MRTVWKLIRWLALGATGLLVAGLVVVFLLRFADGPTGIVAGGAFSTGTAHSGPEPDWSFLENRGEVQFQLLAVVGGGVVLHCLLLKMEPDERIETRTIQMNYGTIPSAVLAVLLPTLVHLVEF